MGFRATCFRDLKTLSVTLLCCFQRTSHLSHSMEKCVTHESLGTNLNLIDKSVNRFLVVVVVVRRCGRKIHDNRKAFYFRKRKILLPSADERVGFITYSSSLLFIINYYAALKFLCFEGFLSPHMWFPMFFRGFSCRKMCSSCSGERTTERNKRITE